MRDALVIAGLVGVVMAVRYWQVSREAMPASVPESSAAAAASFLAGTGSPDVVLGAAGGFGPLRSAWG